MPCRPMSCSSPATKSHDVRLPEASAGRRPRDEVGDPAGVTGAHGRAEVGEVRHGLECCVQLSLAESSLQGWFVGQDEAPVRLRRAVAQHLGGRGAERVDDARVQLLAASLPGHCDGGVDSCGAVEDLDGVCEVEQAHRERDRVAADIAGHALAVPAREHLLQKVADVRAKAKALSHLCRGQAVRHQSPLDSLATGADEVGGEPEPLDPRAACPHVAEHEPEHGQAGGVDLVAVGPESDVVTEPGSDLGCVGDATDPGQGGHVVEGAAFFRPDAEVIPQPCCDGPRSEHVLHRLAQAEVRGQREGSDQLGEPEPGVAFARFHGHRLRVALPALGGFPSLWGEHRTCTVSILPTVDSTTRTRRSPRCPKYQRGKPGRWRGGL